MRKSVIENKKCDYNIIKFIDNLYPKVFFIKLTIILWVCLVIISLICLPKYSLILELWSPQMIRCQPDLHFMKTLASYAGGAKAEVSSYQLLQGLCQLQKASMSRAQPCREVKLLRADCFRQKWVTPCGFVWALSTFPPAHIFTSADRTSTRCGPKQVFCSCCLHEQLKNFVWYKWFINKALE